MIDLIPLLMELGGHSPNAVKRRARVLLVEPAHQQQVFLAVGLWLVIETAASHTQQLTLASHTQLRVAGFDQRPLIIN